LPQQDFVLFEAPRPTRHHRQPSRLAHQSPANGVVPSQQQQHQQQHYQQQQQSSGSPAVQSQQVANIIQATGHATSSSAFNNNNRFSSTQNLDQFYALSAPSSTVALNQTGPANTRPPVPLFTQSTGSIHQGKMFSDLEDFTAFGGGASTGYDMSRSASSSTNMGTISPSELMGDQFMSAPNSSAITALTSPSIYDVSPDGLRGDFDISPSFDAEHMWDSNPDHWTSLFPDSGNTAQQTLAVEQSPALHDDIDIEQSVTADQRRKSSNPSPKSSGRHSLVSGVNSRKRDKPLPPIVIEDPNDTVAVKRARNTLAARKSRERKAKKMEEYEAEIARLEEERDYWKQLAVTHGAKV
jgi:hypothetical protein